MINGYGNHLAWTVRVPESGFEYQSDLWANIDALLVTLVKTPLTIQLWEAKDHERPTKIFCSTPEGLTA